MKPLTDPFTRYEIVDRGFETQCWSWRGMLNDRGYGIVCLNYRTRRAHRAYYERFVGPIPAGLTIDHLCNQRDCVNPDHLEPVTQAENVRRGIARRRAAGLPKQTLKTHCVHGHPLSGDNLYLAPRGTRGCRTCLRAQRAARTERERSAA